MKDIKVVELERNILTKFNEKDRKVLNVQVCKNSTIILTFDAKYLKASEIILNEVQSTDIPLNDVFKYYFTVINSIDIDDAHSIVAVTGLDKFILDFYNCTNVEVLKIANGIIYTFIK